MNGNDFIEFAEEHDMNVDDVTVEMVISGKEQPYLWG